MKDSDFYWMVGILEGEGTFLKGSPSNPTYPSVVIVMTDEDTMQKLQTIIGGTLRRYSKRKAHWKDTYHLAIRGKSSVLLMQSIKPFMSKRRQLQIANAIACYEDKTQPLKINSTQTAEILKLNASGKSTRELGRMYNVSNVAIFKILKKNKGL